MPLVDSIEDNQIVEFVITLVSIAKDNVNKFKTVYQQLVDIVKDTDMSMVIQLCVNRIIELLEEL